MEYPTLNTIASTKEAVEEFRGYNHNLRIGDGENWDEENLTSDYYPVFSPRKARGYYATPASPQGMIAKDVLCYVDGENFVYGSQVIALGLSTAAEDCPKKLVSMGAYVCVFPDKKYVNTANLSDFGSMEAAYTSTGTVTFTMCTSDGTDMENVTVSGTAPESPVNGQYWLDTSGSPSVLKKWAVTTAVWVTIQTTYVKIASDGIGTGFSVGDGVTLAGITAESLGDLNGSALIYGQGDNYLVVVGVLGNQVTQDTPVTVKRVVPNMDFVTESGNRLWGCRYGTAVNGQTVNEIYACKLGDFKNWNVYSGISTDAYTASVGSDGPFTGAVTHLGYPLFFKENCMHKVYGNYPSNFQIQMTALRGVQEGCGESLAIVGETLFYKARGGVCAFDGSLPVDVSAALGKVQYGSAVGGAVGDKYYISMADTAGVWSLFAYDTKTGIWHREDGLHAESFATLKSELYAVDASNRNILALLGSGEAAEDTVQWMAETGDLGLSDPYGKYVSKISLRMQVSPETNIDLFVNYDSGTEWEHLCNIRSMHLRSITVPIRPRRCDHLRLRLKGEGNVKIYSLVKTISGGGDTV